MSYSPPVHQAPLASEKLVADRKILFLDLKENTRGRFIKITEDTCGRRNTVILPVANAAEFHQLLGRLIEFEATMKE